MNPTKLSSIEVIRAERIGGDVWSAVQTALDACDPTSAVSLAERREAVAAARAKIEAAKGGES